MARRLAKASVDFSRPRTTLALRRGLFKHTYMDETPLYLKQNVQIEPLVDQWYAWSHLIPPATAARNLTHRHLPIMESYLAAPQEHADAVENPRLRGGPFIDYGGGRTNEIAALLDQTKAKRTALIELSQMLEALNSMLTAEARGFSLQPLYSKVPTGLRGYVELVYDLNNQPSFRLIEALLYCSRYYDPSAQSLSLSTVSGDDRPFALSTPRLSSDDVIHWQVPFDNPRVDRFMALKSIPSPLSAIRDIVDVPERSAALLKSILTTEPPPKYERYAGQRARWRYFGHACVLVETASVSILFDPVLSYTYESDISRYTYLDLPDVIDFVVITHNHQDHVLLETMLQIRHKVRHVVVPSGGGMLQDPSMKLLLQRVGFNSVIELSEMDEWTCRDVSITALPFLGEHADLNIRAKSAYLVRIGSRSMIFAADSCNIEPRLYEHLHKELGDVDVLFVGMECVGAPLTWLYGPLVCRVLDRAMDASRRLAGSNYEQAIQIVNEFRCREVYVYAMGQEPWLNYVMSLKYTETSRPIVESNRLLHDCRGRGIVAERLFGEREMFLQ